MLQYLKKKLEPLILSPGSAGDWESNNRRQDDRGYTGKEYPQEIARES